MVRRLVSTAITAVIVSLLTLTVAGAVAQTDPNTDRTIVPAGLDADKVDGKHATGFTNKKVRRRNKLVATDKQGYLPSNIVKPFWTYLRGVPAGFADGVDDAGVTAATVARVESAWVDIAAGGNTYATASCPAGSVVIGGGGYSSGYVALYDSYSSSASNWVVYYHNPQGFPLQIKAVAQCLRIDPTGLLTTAGDRRAAPAATNK